MKMSEIGDIVIWPNHLHHTESILDNLKDRFSIIGNHAIQWNDDIIFQNFYRFYGDRLSTKAIKEKTSSGTTLKLITFRDDNPQHEFRLTARGVERVNSNFFDLKKLFRKKFQTRFGIHGSNAEAETNKDLCLLLGMNMADYKKQHPECWNGEVIKIKRNITGAHGWDSLDQFFHLINAVHPYIILRNSDELTEDLQLLDDIDFLVQNRRAFAYFSNARKMSKGTERANFRIRVSNQEIDIDIRYIGDNYFDTRWQMNCMKSRLKHPGGFYIMDEENQYHSLAYHALIHKRAMPEKYKAFFNMTDENLKNNLYKFMHEHDYHMVEPKDVTLFFNRNNGGDIKFCRERRLRTKRGISGSIKKTLNKFNNLVHCRRGPA